MDEDPLVMIPYKVLILPTSWNSEDFSKTVSSILMK
jgi:hypothetical protein